VGQRGLSQQLSARVGDGINIISINEQPSLTIDQCIRCPARSPDDDRQSATARFEIDDAKSFHFQTCQTISRRHREDVRYREIERELLELEPAKKSDGF